MTSHSFDSQANAQGTPANAASKSDKVYTDQEFNAAIPQIDGVSPKSPSTLPAPSPAAPPIVDLKNSPPTMIMDNATDAPLAPLKTFAAAPLDQTSGTEQISAAAVPYAWRIDGLAAIVTSPQSLSLEKQFKARSALAKGKSRATNTSMISARLTEDGELLQALLAAEGYFDAQIATRVVPPGRANAVYLAVMTVAAGPRYRLNKIIFDTPPPVPTDLITTNFLPQPNDPIVTDTILGAEANLTLVLPQHGYPFAKLGQRDILLNPTTATGDYTLPIVLGARSRFGVFQITGDPVFDLHHLAILARFQPGELYDSRKVDDLRKALVATNLFSAIAVEPVAAAAPLSPDGTGIADLRVTQTVGPEHSLAANAGYQTGQGITLDASRTDRNRFPPEGAGIANATLGTSEQGLGATFRRSNAGKRDRTVELSFNVLHSKLAAYRAFTGRLAGHISRDSTPIWQKRITYSYGFELLGTNEQAYDINAVLTRKTYVVAALPLQIGLDTSNNLLDPTHGFRLTARLSPEASLGSGRQKYIRSSVEATGYLPLGKSLVLAGRARAAAIQGISVDELTPSRRYYGGGGGSVRGFGYQQLSPKDLKGDLIGGRSLNEVSGELRYRFGSYGVVSFVDAGQVYTSSIPRFTNWRLGAGVGARLYTAFGPLRFDVATPIARKPGESRVAVYVSIGQAF